MAVGVLLLTIAAPGESVAQDPDHVQLLETYRHGSLAAAVQAVAAWPEARIRASARSLGTGVGAAQAKASAMLHTEAAFQLYPDDRASAHVDAARRAIARLQAPSADEFVARWHGLVAVYHAMHHEFVLAQRELNQARSRIEGVPDIELLAGTILEVQVGFAEPNVRGSWSTFDVGTLQNDLNSLVNTYQRVVERHPTFVEARLRLGWALYLARSPSARARAQLEPVVEQATRSDLRYLAHLFLAAVAERDRRFDDAMREYEAAHAAEGHQTSLVALLGMAGARGLTSHVAELTKELARKAAAPATNDPWLYYNSGFTGGGLLDGLRAEVRQP